MLNDTPVDQGITELEAGLIQAVIVFILMVVFFILEICFFLLNGESLSEIIHERFPEFSNVLLYVFFLLCIFYQLGKRLLYEIFKKLTVMKGKKQKGEIIGKDYIVHTGGKSHYKSIILNVLCEDGSEIRSFPYFSEPSNLHERTCTVYSYKEIHILLDFQ